MPVKNPAPPALLALTVALALAGGTALKADPAVKLTQADGRIRVEIGGHCSPSTSTPARTGRTATPSWLRTEHRSPATFR